MAVDQEQWTPEWFVSPGEILAEALSERGISQAELARRMDRPAKTINEIIHGKAAITPATAIQLERTLGIAAGLWIGLEVEYRQSLARAEDAAALRAEKGFLGRFPVKELIRRGFLIDHQDDAGTLADLLALFGVSSPKAWGRVWDSVPALRESETFKSKPESLAAWIRIGQLSAERREVAEYDEAAFRQLLQEIRPWTRMRPLGTVMQRVIDRCAAVGVAVVLVKELPGTHVSGAAYRTPDGKRVIQLSDRYKRDDHFWFSFFHEAGHILMSDGRLSIDADGGADPLEQAAVDDDEARVNEFAREVLLASALVQSFMAEHPKVDAGLIKDFAKQANIAPGVALGRLQRERHVSHAALNHLKSTVEISDLT